jgi:protein-export membrane protein SecD
MKKRTRYFIFLFFVVFGLYFLIPTFRWYVMFDDDQRNDARYQGELLKIEVESKVTRAMDRLGKGEADEEIVAIVRKAFLKSNEVRIYNKANPDDRIDTKQEYSYEEIRDFLVEIIGKEKKVDSFVQDKLENHYLTYYEDVRKVKDNIIKLGLDLQGGAYAVVEVNFDHPKMLDKYPEGVPKEERTAMIDSAVIKIRNRIDKYGVAETQIQKVPASTPNDKDRIIVNLPGVKQANELRQIIETVGVLQFKLVSKEGTELMQQIKRQADVEGVSLFDRETKELKPEFQAQLPPDTEMLYVANRDKFGVEKDTRQMLVVFKEALVVSNQNDPLDITEASVQQGQFGTNVVNFELGEAHAQAWAKVTGDNIGREIAIILDGTILQHPVVKDKISGGRSQITLGDAPLEELRTLALILKSGSLSVPLEITSENTVGASLGRDTIEKGLFAIMLAVIFVLVFMVLWYNVGGLIADFAMALNLLLLMGGLALFKGTLTLPGIAGIILTVGMAVDANVIILNV